uniref:SWIM-type domain-containing protein n=1 Tax=Fagus sylvatica TaxID=28930 RepID=A0A2N9HYT5_FAGSY
MTNLYFEIEIHSGGQFERNLELVYLGGKVSTYLKVDPNRLSYFEIQDMVAECGSPSISLVYYLIPVEGGVEPLQVVGQSDFGGVVDEGDEVEGDELNELVSYDWMNDGLEGADFADDIFGGNEDEDDNEVVGNGGDTASDAQSLMQVEVGDNGGNNASEGNNGVQAEVGDNGGNNASDAQPSMQPEVGSNGGNNAQPGVGSNEVQEPDWTEPGIEDYEIHTSTISDDEDSRDGAPEFNQQTGMRKPDLVIGMKFPNSKHSQVNSSYVARKYLQDFGKNPRPIIGLDGCHLKCRFGGQLLAATARDGNDNIFPIADLNLVFISDRQKGLVPAFKKLFPKVEHRFCLKHIYSNFKLLFKGLELKDALWSCAVASTEREFERRMEYLKVNNISESFNAMILPTRDKPILSMLEWIRVRLMTRLHTKRIVMEKYGGLVCPNVQDKLEKLKMESRSFSAMPFGRFKYKVDNSYERHVVDLTKKECSCRIWDLTGIPCKHGVATIYKNLEHPEDYLHDSYLKEAYLDVYSEIIYPMPGQDQWIKSGHLPSQPPHVLRPPGRPKKLRRRDPDEPRNPHKVSRMNRQIKCGKCNKLGHNSRSCNADITGETAWQKRQKLKQQKTAQGGSFAATNQGHTSSQPPLSQPQPSQPATRSRFQQWFSSTQPTTHAPRKTWHSRASSSQLVSVRDSIARGAGSGVGRGRGATSVSYGAGRGRGAGMGSTSGAGRGLSSGEASGAGMGATYGVGRGRGATYGVGSGASSSRGAGRGSTSGAGRGSTSGQTSGAGRGSISGVGRGSSNGQASGAGRGSISGEASGASRSWTNGAAVKNLGLARTRGSGSSRPPKLPVVGGKGK